MLRFKCILFLMFFAGADACLASDDCSYVRLDLNAKSMAHVKNRFNLNDDCYAQAASAAVDAYRFSHGDQRYNLVTSGDYENLSYLAANKKELRSGGETTAALDDLKKELCLTNSTTVDLDETVALSIIEGFFSDLYKDIKPLSLDKKSPYQIFLARISEDLPSGISCSSLLGKNDKHNIEKLYNLLLSAGAPEFLKTIFRSQCNHTEFHIPTACKIAADHNSIKNVINTELAYGNAQPLLIDFPVAILKEGLHSYTLKGWVNDFKLGWKLRTDHAALIIGRKRGSHGQCQYLVNSAIGDSCKYETKSSKDWVCENGSFWVDADLLDSTITSIAYLPQDDVEEKKCANLR